MEGLIGGFLLVVFAFALGGWLNKREFGSAYENPFKDE